MNRIEDRALGNSYAFCEDEEEEIPTIKDGIEIPTPLVNCPNSPSSVLTPTKYTKEKFWVRFEFDENSLLTRLKLRFGRKKRKKNKLH